MTQSLTRTICLSALVAACGAASVDAQCTTCATPTVAYYPATAVVQPVTAWYRPGLFDRLRMRRWGLTPVATAPAVAAYTASYTPYVASYSPTSYVTAYAPLQTVTQASYVPATDACSTCTQVSYTPATSVLTPVVSAPACTTCAYPCTTCETSACTVCAMSPCVCANPCATCATGVGQTSYAQSTPGCACDGATGTPTYSQQAPTYSQQGSTTQQGSTGAPPTPQPRLDEGAPSSSQYPGTPVQPEGSTTPQTPDPAPAPDESTFTPPQLLGPYGDRTATRPSVDVWHAVYRQPATTAKVSGEAKPATTRTQAEVDAEGWYSVPAGR